MEYKFFRRSDALEVEHHDPDPDERRRSRSPCSSRVSEVPRSLVDRLGDDLLSLSRTPEVFHQIENESHMSLKLPKCGLTAGRIIRHSENVFEGWLAKHQPMTFMFGLTHCPIFRWYHRPYGYKHGKSKFTSMVILYAAATVTGPAFLEAALISKYGSAPAPSIAFTA